MTVAANRSAAEKANARGIDSDRRALETSRPAGAAPESKAVRPSKIFDVYGGEHPYGKRTICEVHCDIYDLCVLSLCGTNPDVLRRITALLEEAYLMGKRMNDKLVQHKDGTDGWAEIYSSEEYRAQQASRRERMEALRRVTE